MMTLKDKKRHCNNNKASLQLTSKV